ncbi:MAG: 50S ribosomal protein L11 methyltransferase [Ginsengibacter sp.]
MKKYFKIQIETESNEQAEILMAQLSAILFYAFDEEDNLLNAYVKEKDFDEKKLKNILPPDMIFSKKVIEEKNWNLEWERGIKPVTIKDFVSIRPSFAKPIKTSKYDLIITPKMSFGTGHHDTTYLMVAMMESIDFNNKSVVDFGTGTGVLAILAEKLGASKIMAIDFDEWSIRNATENIEANNCQHIILQNQNNLEGIYPSDIILANINLNVLKNELSSIAAATKTGSLFLASGFLINDEIEIKNIFGKRDFVKLKSGHRGGWLTILFRKN